MKRSPLMEKCHPGNSAHRYKICEYHLEHIDKAIDKLDNNQAMHLLEWFKSQDGTLYLHSNMTWLCLSDCSKHADSQDPSEHCSGISAMFIYPNWNHWETFP